MIADVGHHAEGLGHGAQGDRLGLQHHQRVGRQAQRGPRDQAQARRRIDHRHVDVGRHRVEHLGQRARAMEGQLVVAHLGRLEAAARQERQVGLARRAERVGRGGALGQDVGQADQLAVALGQAVADPTLRIEVDEHDAAAAVGQGQGQVHGDRGLADAALLAADDDPMGHGFSSGAASPAWPSERRRVRLAEAIGSPGRTASAWAKASQAVR
jgi:hypothetical protein